MFVLLSVLGFVSVHLRDVHGSGVHRSQKALF